MQPPNDRTVLSLTMTHRDPNGKFRNPWPRATPHGLGDFLKWVWQRRGTRRPDPPSPAAPASPVAIPAFPKPRAAAGEVAITWIGHSSFLLQIGSANILLDPIWSERASPVHFAGPKRIVAPGVNFNSLPPIDLVLLSHDHYDHLDLATVRSIAAKQPHAEWIVPLEVGTWLRARGVTVIAELDWWQSVRTHNLDVTCTPAQHFSGRRPTNRDFTLWCGWTIRSGDRAIYFAGDTGRHPEFGAVTRRLGPFDAAFLPIGAYDPRCCGCQRPGRPSASDLTWPDASCFGMEGCAIQSVMVRVFAPSRTFTWSCSNVADTLYLLAAVSLESSCWYHSAHSVMMRWRQLG